MSSRKAVNKTKKTADKTPDTGLAAHLARVKADPFTVKIEKNWPPSWYDALDQWHDQRILTIQQRKADIAKLQKTAEDRVMHKLTMALLCTNTKEAAGKLQQAKAARQEIEICLFASKLADEMLNGLNLRKVQIEQGRQSKILIAKKEILAVEPKTAKALAGAVNS